MTKINQWSKIAKDYAKIEKNVGDGKDVMLPYVERALGNVKGKRILEIGCGYGLFSRHFANKGAKVTGIDISKEMIDIAINMNDQNTPNIQYFVKNANDLSNIKDKFDFVLAIMLFPSVSDKSDFMEIFKQVSNVMKQDAKFIIMDIHPFSKRTLNTALLTQNFPEKKHKIG